MKEVKEIRAWVEHKVKSVITQPARSKQFVWTSSVRIFTDGGNPGFNLVPIFRRNHYAAHWGLTGFTIVWAGREWWFSFGEDSNGLYKDVKR